MPFPKHLLCLPILLLVLLTGCEDQPDYALPFEKSDYLKVSREYGFRRWHPIIGARHRFYHGMVFELADSATVYAIQRGRVTTIDKAYYKYWGNNITIAHNDSLIAKYYHLGKLLVSEGDSVSKGQKIAESGNTGITTVNGLGIRVLVHGDTINPADIIPAFKKYIEESKDQ